MRDRKRSSRKIVVDFFKVFRKSTSAGKRGEFFRRYAVNPYRRRLDVRRVKKEIFTFYVGIACHYVRKLNDPPGS